MLSSLSSMQTHTTGEGKMRQVCSHCASGLGIISSDTHIYTHTQRKRESTVRGANKFGSWLLIMYLFVCSVFWGLCGGGSCERRKYCTKKAEK